VRLNGRAAHIFAVALLAGADGVLAYVQSNLVDSGFPDVGLHLPGDSLVLRLEQDASFRITNGSDLTALVDSIARWTDVATSNVTVSEAQRFNLPSPIDASSGLANDNRNQVFFAETDTAARIGGAIAVAFFWVGGDGSINDCDIVFNERLYTFSTATPGNPNQILGSNTYDLGEIATHEMGHCLGLDHSPVAGRFSATTGLQVSGFSSGDFTYQATLYPYGSRTIQGRSLSQDDASGVSFIYPNGTLLSTTGSISGRVLDGATLGPIRGAHVIAVSAGAPDIPIVGVISDVQAGGPGGEFNIVGLAPGDYYVRIEPLVGTSNPFTMANTHFTGFVTGFPWEYYDGPGESGFDTQTDRAVVAVAAGQTVSGIDILTNVGAPDPNEPNGTPASATPISCEQGISASIVPRGDIDYYAVVVTDATSLRAEINAARSGSDLDAILGVFDAAGDRLAFADNTLGLDPVIILDLAAGSTYYIAVASFNDSEFTGADARTFGTYTLTLTCVVPAVRPGTCPGRVLYAGLQGGPVLAISDADENLRFDGQTAFAGAGSGQGTLASRRDGGVCIGFGSGAIAAHWDDTGEFVADRSASLATGLPDAQPIVAIRRSGAEYLYAGDRQGGGTIMELVDEGGGFDPERTTVFTSAPEFVLSLGIDEAGTLYVLDGFFNSLGGILWYRDTDGDGVADRSGVFADSTPDYGMIVARRPGEVYAANIFAGQIDRIRDSDGDGVADSVTTYAAGLALNTEWALAFDEGDVLYAVEGGNRVVALPDDDGDGTADRQVQFSPLNDGILGITFGPGPPEAVSAPSSYNPVTLAPGPGGLLRLSWEDQGPTVPAYNIHEGTIGSFYSHAPVACHVTGTPDGAGGRFLDITPAEGDRYYLVTASDSCGEGSPGRASDGRRRPLTGASCGATP
jgi:hypothetical protein